MKTKPTKSKLMTRVWHVEQPDMVGRFLTQDGDDVLVQWDGGCMQWMPREKIRT